MMEFSSTNDRIDENTIPPKQNGRVGDSTLPAGATSLMSERSQVAPARSPGPITPEPTAQSPSRSWRKIVVIAVIVLFVAVIAWRLKTSKAAEQAELDKAAAEATQPTPVQVSPVQRQTVPVFLTALGTVTAYNTVTINSRVSGQLVRVNFREGQNVHKGEVLMEIDPRPYQAALDQAIGQLARDEANLRNMEAEADRYTKLYDAGVVSKEQEQLQVANGGQAAGSIATDKASIEAARVNLAYCRITSPIDGVVGLRQVDPGNIVNAGQSNGLVVITQVHPIALIFTLPEDQLPKVQMAMRAAGKGLTVEAYDRTDSHLIAKGSLLTIDNQIDTTTGTAKLKAVFDNTDNTLFSNQFVNVRLILSERANATVVPTSAVSSGTKGDYVFVVSSGPTPQAKLKNLPPPPSMGNAPPPPSGPQYHVDSVPVHVDYTLGTSSVLADGTLQQGQQLVVDGQEKLVDGSPVNPQVRQTGGGQ
jgi:multidrug efflux system membrane fusion protein